MYCWHTVFISKKKGTEVPFGSSVSWASTLSRLKRPLRIDRRLRLLVLLDLGSSPTLLSTSILFAQSKPGPAH